MNEAMIEPIILGHNPFFGVDHLSQERGNEKAKHFEDVERIMELLRHCHTLGVRGMMLSTHPMATGVCQAMANEPKTFSSWRIYPLIPYINKYVRGANVKGLVNLVTDILSQASLGQKLSLMMKGGRGIVGKDIKSALKLLLDIELLPFKNVHLGGVFLHDTLTDLSLSLEAYPMLELFKDHISDVHGVTTGFTTKNLPLLQRRFESLGWKEPLVMSSFNAEGFYMNPSREECEKALTQSDVRFVAMNTLASGQLSPEVAYRYLGRFPAIRSVVVGVSQQRHADQTVGAIRRYLSLAQ